MTQILLKRTYNPLSSQCTNEEAKLCYKRSSGFLARSSGSWPTFANSELTVSEMFLKEDVKLIEQKQNIFVSLLKNKK